jgi:hypothetical protein
MAEPYDLRSNIKGKPGSQGTLFQVTDKGLLNPDQRWPKGYTPERKNAVADAVVRPSIHVNYRPNHTGDDREVRTGTRSTEYSDRKVNYGVVNGEPHVANESRQHVRDLVDNIARSTVPLEHLGGVQWRHNAESHLGNNDPGVTTQAHWDRTGDALSKGDPVIRMRRGTEGGYVPIHEIGHHVSYNEATEHSQYRTGYQQGSEEAFADRYAFEHFREPGSRRTGPQPMQALRTYPTPQGDPQRSMNFASAYHAGRGDIPVADPFAKYFSGEGRTHRQQMFVDRNDAEARGETLFKTWDDGEKTDFYTHPEPGASGVMSDRHIGWSRRNKP